MSSQKQSMFKGIALLGSFAAVLVLLFVPFFNGYNALEFMDNLYNSISKGSANYLPSVTADVQRFKSNPIDVTLALADEKQAAQAVQLITRAGGRARADGKQLKIEGDLVAILANAVADAEKMYANQGEAVRSKYGFDERLAMFNWWSTLKAMDFELNKQKQFKEAKLVALVQNRAIETAYNYYGIQAQSIRERYAIVIASLVFYVVYTLWYGFGVMYLFEGFGLKLGH
ncbi:MAG: hypothetical protein MUD16_04310 [Desulfobacterales bacterium]|jgi:hypothetical protein|nr:hypothetical protein [Desulfobacterales bacterium]